MIITCPYCQTRYQVTYEAIGATGRKVQCATCSRDWMQQPPAAADELHKDHLEAELNEDRLDEAFVQEQRAAGLALERKLEAVARTHVDGPAKVDPAVQRKRQRAFKRRQSIQFARLPLARLRRSARVVGAVVLVAMVLSGLLGRTRLVELFPAMADVYSAVGLGVNVVGLTFENVHTLRTPVDGKDVLMVNATIRGLSSQPAPVPPVVVTLLDGAGKSIYQWSVKPEGNDLMAGESTPLKTQLTLPPGDIVRVKLAFAGGADDRGDGAAPAAGAPGNAAAAGPAPTLLPLTEHH